MSVLQANFVYSAIEFVLAGTIRKISGSHTYNGMKFYYDTNIRCTANKRRL